MPDQSSCILAANTIHGGADPAVTLKSIWKAPDGQVLSERTACAYGDKALFDRVMAEFADLGRQMNEAIAKEHPEKPKQ